MIPDSESVLNSKALVGDDVGLGKKIQIRDDKIDFKKQAEAVFEKREFVKNEKAKEEAKLNSINYLKGI